MIPQIIIFERVDGKFHRHNLIYICFINYLRNCTDTQHWLNSQQEASQNAVLFYVITPKSWGS